MMHAPVPLRKKIDPASLDERNYTQSLLEAAQRAGLADEAFRQHVRQELLEALAEACRAYTGGMSSSLRAETVSELLASLVCALDAWLLSFPAAEDALDALRQIGAAQGCRLGARRLRALLGPTRTFHAALLRASIRTENELYNGTLREGMPVFFRLYDPIFGAHRIHITADYPVCFYPEGFCGLGFIRRYLQNLAHENTFLRLFRPAAVDACINRFARFHATSVRELYANLYEVVLAAALACTLAGENAAFLFLNAAGCELLLKKLSGGPPPALEPFLEKALAALCPDVAVPGPAHQYWRKTCAQYRAELARMMPFAASGGTEPPPVPQPV